MKLKPVKPGERPRLRDEDAARPEGMDEDEVLERRVERIGKELTELQGALYAEARQSLLVVFQARDAGGKDGVVKRVFGPLNTQGHYVQSFGVPTETELKHDYLWRAHQHTPQKGYIGVFNRSHYEDLLVVRVEGLVPEKVWRKRFRQINEFERHLSENGVVILKFFLHISHDEQKQRLLERLDDPTKNWKFKTGDLKAREKWDQYNDAYTDVLRRCSTPWAPWFVVPGDDKRARDYLVARTVLRTLRRMKPVFPPADPEVLAWRDKII